MDVEWQNLALKTITELPAFQLVALLVHGPVDFLMEPIFFFKK